MTKTEVILELRRLFKQSEFFNSFAAGFLAASAEWFFQLKLKIKRFFIYCINTAARECGQL